MAKKKASDVTSSINSGWRESEMRPKKPSQSEESRNGKRELLLYLIEVAQKTEGAEVWRALFAEIYQRVKAAE